MSDAARFFSEQGAAWYDQEYRRPGGIPGSGADHPTSKGSTAMTAPNEAILRIPPGALIVLIGPAACGKSTWALRHFERTQIVASDACRALIADDETDQQASHDAFRLFHFIIGERLKRGLLTVADSTALLAPARADLLKLAATYHRPTVAVVFAVPPETQVRWNDLRPRHVPPAALAKHQQLLRLALQGLCNEGFQQMTVLRSPAEIDQLAVRVGAFSPERDAGPFDVIGDVHGCYDELSTLVARLGYARLGDGWAHPAGRRLVFVGDLADRGPASVAVWRGVLAALDAGNALLVAGNHDNKLMRWLLGRPVRIGRGLGSTVAEIEALPEPEQSAFRERLLGALRLAPGYLLLDDGRLVVTHAGIRDDMIGRWDRHIAAFCLYGHVVGTDADGLPIRRDWAQDRPPRTDRPLIVYGHSVVATPAVVNDTLDIDTGCCFGGQLTALRYPERELVAVPARRVYFDE